MNTPNWMKNSGKPKKTKGIAKGRLRAAKQTLKAVKDKYGTGTRTSKRGPFSCIIVGQTREKRVSA